MSGIIPPAIFLGLYLIRYHLINIFKINQSKFSIVLFFGIPLIVLLFLYSKITTFVNPIYDFVIKPIIFKLQSGDITPTFLEPESIYYLSTSFTYNLIRYIIPLFILLLFSLSNIKTLLFELREKQLASTYLISQGLFLIGISLVYVFSLSFISIRSTGPIFSYLILLNIFMIWKSKYTSQLKNVFYAAIILFVCLIPMVIFTTSAPYKYNQFNKQHVASLDWIKQTIDSDSVVYSDLKMTGAITAYSGIKRVYHAPTESFGWLDKETVPIYYGLDIDKALSALSRYQPNYLILTGDMTNIAIQTSNEMLNPTTKNALLKYDLNEYFDKVYENSYVTTYRIFEFKSNV